MHVDVCHLTRNGRDPALKCARTALLQHAVTRAAAKHCCAKLVSPFKSNFHDDDDNDDDCSSICN